MDEQHRHGRRRRSAEASITSGVLLAAAFGVAWALVGGWFWIFPLLFAGVLPAVEGVRKLIQERQGSSRHLKADEGYVEKQILRTAKDNGGIVTPTLVALKTDLSIKEAEQALQKMAQNGYAAMQVRDDGRIEYEFLEFTPRLEE